MKTNCVLVKTNCVLVIPQTASAQGHVNCTESRVCKPEPEGPGMP